MTKDLRPAAAPPPLVTQDPREIPQRVSGLEVDIQHITTRFGEVWRRLGDLENMNGETAKRLAVLEVADAEWLRRGNR
jgi:hypothetical protein